MKTCRSIGAEGGEVGKEGFAKLEGGRLAPGEPFVKN